MIHYLLLIAVLGLIFFLVEKYVPMAEPFGLIFRIVAAVIAIVLLLAAFGISIPGAPRF